MRAEFAQDVEVMQALLRRRDEPDVRDGHRIALVIGGGGMRGAYSGGMAHALDAVGLGECFDVVYGSSAGAYIGAGLLLGDGRGSSRIFFEDMASRDFVDFGRLRRGHPVVSLDHLIDQVLVHSKPMPWERLRDSPVQLKVIATDLHTMKAEVLQPHSVAEWKLALRATAAIPGVAGRSVPLQGRHWIDGSVAEPLPVRRALADGATHVLALVNRTAASVLPIPAERTRPRWVSTVDKVRPGLGAMAQQRHRLRGELMVLNSFDHPARQGRHLQVINPAQDVGVSGLTIDPARVERATEVGYDAVLTAMAMSTR